jgi:hypothetical protein
VLKEDYFFVLNAKTDVEYVKKVFHPGPGGHYDFDPTLLISEDKQRGHAFRFTIPEEDLAEKLNNALNRAIFLETLLVTLCHSEGRPFPGANLFSINMFMPELTAFCYTFGENCGLVHCTRLGARAGSAVS